MKQKTLAWKNLQSKIRFYDSLFLILLILLSVVPYVLNLGLYSDDWGFLEGLNLSEDQSLPGLIRSMFWGNMHENPNFSRPVYLIYLATLYWVFGLNPLGYHLVNSLVLISGIILFYWVLRELKQNRLLALAVSLIYGLLPHYSTNRLWITCIHANLSMVLYFLSLYCDLRMLKAQPKFQWRWKIFGILSLVSSVLAYELFLPLFLLLNPLLILYRKRQLEQSASGFQFSKGKLTLLLGSNLLAIILTVVFKLSRTDRAGEFPGIKRLIYRLTYVPIEQSIRINFGDYGFNLPKLILKIILNDENITTLILAAMLALAIFFYLYQVAIQSKNDVPKWRNMLILIVLGLTISGLSFSYLLSWTTPTGIGNRYAMAAAIGVACVQVGGCGLVSNLMSSSYSRKRFFCLSIALLCSCGFLINKTIASFWITAYHQQQEILTDIRQQFPTLPVGSTLILDGFCPYVGPGIVFETNWDVKGALRIIYRDRTLKGDVVKPNLKVKDDGISTFMYGTEYHYPYQQLFIYNFAHKMSYQLTDAETARSYFAKFNPDYSKGCPEGREGEGVPIFNEVAIIDHVHQKP